MLTAGRLARRCGLSRSTLLYYDRIGLLRPSGRSDAGYRLYAEADLARLERILLYRETGLPLAVIRTLLDAETGSLAGVLESRLAAVNSEIAGLRAQQRLILQLLGEEAAAPATRALDKRGWVEILRASGMDEEGMRCWHREFETLNPEAHQDFLESIGIPPGEIRDIREQARAG